MFSFKRLLQKADLGGFAAPFDPFNTDEIMHYRWP
jgi:hypothetical protein